MVRLPRNEEQTHRLKCRPQVWPSGLTLAMTLTLNFQGQIWNLLYLNKKMVRSPQNEKQTYQLISRHQLWPSGLTLAMTLTLNFLGQIWNLLYLCQKSFDCHETESKHIDWTLGHKCYHQIWPWPWPWPWHFKVKYGISCISTKSCPIPIKQKANISIKLQASNLTNGFDLGHDLDIWIVKVKCDLDHLVTKVRCKDLPDSDRGDFRCRRAVDSSSCFQVNATESHQLEINTGLGTGLVPSGKSHYLSQSWPTSPFGVTRPQWVEPHWW